MNNTATEAQKNVVVINAAFAIQVVRPEKRLKSASPSLKNHWKVAGHWLH